MPKPPDLTDDDVAEEIPVRTGELAPQEEEPGEPTRVPAETAAGAAGDVETIARERDDYYDRLLRKTAEFENYRKRVDRERREQAEYAASEVLTDLLPLVDDLERALQADAESGAEAYRKGVELIHKQMLDLLRRRGVTPVDAVGREFDPHVHQAVAHEVVPGHPEGEVVEEFRRGYRLRDRLLRPAMVKVAKA
jgi:molecular chaperone GrpE